MIVTRCYISTLWKTGQSNYRAQSSAYPCFFSHTQTYTKCFYSQSASHQLKPNTLAHYHTTHIDPGLDFMYNEVISDTRAKEKHTGIVKSVKSDIQIMDVYFIQIKV